MINLQGMLLDHESFRDSYDVVMAAEAKPPIFTLTLIGPDKKKAAKISPMRNERYRLLNCTSGQTTFYVRDDLKKLTSDALELVRWQTMSHHYL